MVLLVDSNNDSTSSGTTMEKEGKSLDQPEPKRLSLLVDYSKGKAAINKQRKRELLGDSSQEQSVRRPSMMETLEDAMELTNLDDEKSLNDSINLEEATASTQVKFRVRKRSVKRSTTFDERTLSSYDNLQRSIRSNMFLSEDATELHVDGASESESQPTPASPPINRRALLAGASKTHQSMRSLTSTTTACSAASRTASDRRALLLSTARMKHQSMRNLTSTNHIPATVPEEGGRRAALASTPCTSCRHVLRRNRTHDGSSSRLHFSFSIHDEDNNNNNDNNNNHQDDLPFLTKRTATKKNSLESPSDHTPTRLSATTDHRRRRVSPKPDPSSQTSSGGSSSIPKSISLDHPPSTRRKTFSPILPTGGRRIRNKPNALDRHSDHIVRHRGDTLSDLIPYHNSNSSSSNLHHHTPATGRRGGGLALMKSHTMSRRNLLSESSLREESGRMLLGGGGRRTGALLKSQTLSRRDLMESSMREDSSSRRDSNLNAMNESTRFFTGSRIRRLDPLL